MLLYNAEPDRILRRAALREMIMTTPNPSTPYDDQPPMPAPTWAPEVPIEEPQPDLLPDELPTPNPDETRDPPVTEPSPI
ncbi:hypothetical protein SAMN05880561_101602 [Rhizobium sp. RU33A]|nr:hypothetical protein SAMN05880561_101602 [Rhizobium sp. RU33A]